MNSIKKIAIVAALFAVFAMETQGATNRLGKIKSTDSVVVSEDDPWFFQWTGKDNFVWPFATTQTSHGPGTFTINPVNGLGGFWIGTNTLAELLQPKIEDEIDPDFNSFLDSSYNLKVGNDTYAGQKAVAIGIPWNTRSDESDFYVSIAGDGIAYYWRTDYMGAVQAERESVAIGDSAQARQPVSVAIGDQAIVGTLHTGDVRLQGLTFDRKLVTTTFSNDVTIVTTNTFKNAVTNYYEIGKYERLPAAGDWEKVSTGEPVVANGTTNITEIYEQKEVGGLYDISYVPPEEWDFYSRLIYGGQGHNYLNNALYGVAVGSRAYVFGYHSVAYGHYAHASRPFSVAIGSESHVYSEGSQAFGYDTDIPNTSPYSLAIGCNASINAGMTNAIVIGVPQVVDFTNLAYRAEEGRIKDRPRAIKSNSINFAFHGKGIQDFYIDGKSLQERIGSEARVIGNTRNDGTVSMESVRSALGLEDDNDIVFASCDGKIRLYTQSYLENTDNGEVHLDEIIINNKTLAEILGNQTPSGGADTEFRTKVMNAATTAQSAVNSATNMVQVKEALNTFFETIKQ